MTSTWVRLVLAISIDGRLAFPHGGKAELGGEGDRKVLEEALAWSDGTLCGGGTLRAHRNTCLIHNPSLISQRRLEGRSTQPIALVVSRKKNFYPEWPFFHQPIERWLICPKKKSEQLDHLSGFTRLIRIEKTWEKTLSNLSEMGLSRLALLGGGELISSLLNQDQVDELQLTLTPRLLGGNHTWIPHRINGLPQTLTNSNAWNLKTVQSLHNNELLLRYIRNRKRKTSDLDK